MESIEKLRDYYKAEDVPGVHRAINEIADAIEAEIAEKYLLLPVDADGVPIRMGDVVAAQDEQPFEVRAFQLDAFGWFAIERLGSQWNVNQLHHVKPRTLEDVLREFYYDASGADAFCTVRINDVLDKYADEIRDLLGVDE